VSRRSPTVPISSGDGADPDLTSIEANWPRIEEAYGKSLLADVRGELLEATRAFLLFEAAERTAEPRKNAAKWIKGCKKAAEELLRAMTLSPSGASDANKFAQHLVVKNFPQGNKGFSTLVSLLPSLNAACVSALEELKDPSMPSFRPGRAWGRWTRQLTEIMRNNSLPPTVSKDTGRKSPFRDLVWELQQLLPVECRRHTQSKPALAKAILDERTRPKRQAAAKDLRRSGDA
jgi:hypothetical protein